MADRSTVIEHGKINNKLPELKSNKTSYQESKESDPKEASETVEREPPVFVKEEDTAGEVNMEAPITSDDVVRAGGLGATDDIGSFLPVALDSTDFESSLRDARDFEANKEEIRRPGLGWT